MDSVDSGQGDLLMVRCTVRSISAASSLSADPYLALACWVTTEVFFVLLKFHHS